MKGFLDKGLETIDCDYNDYIRFIDFSYESIITEELEEVNRILKEYNLNPVKDVDYLSEGEKDIICLHNMLKNSKIIVIDNFGIHWDFDTILFIFEKVKKLDIQTIMFTHRSELISNELLRPDCYFLLENGKLTTFSNRTDKALRYEHNLEKLFRAGSFKE